MSPITAVMVLCATMSLWVTWSLPILSGGELGLVDVAVIGGLFGALLRPAENNLSKKIPLNIFIWAYLLISVMSFLFSPYLVSDNIFKLFWSIYKEMYVTLAFYLFYLVLVQKEQIQKAVHLTLFSSTFSSIIGILQIYFSKPIIFPIGLYADNVIKKHGLEARGIDRALGTFMHSNDFAGFLIFPILISMALYYIAKGNKCRRYLPFLIIIQLAALIGTFSRGAWMGFILSFAVFIVIAKLYKNIGLIVILFLTVSMLFMAKGVNPDLDFIPGNVTARFFSVSNVEKDTAMLPRYNRWNYFAEMSLERPLIGHGLTSPDAVKKYFEDDAASPHSTLLFIAVKKGYIALGIVIIIVINLVVYAWRLYKSGKDSFCNAVGLGVFAGVVGLFLVTSNFASFLEDTQVNILFWFLLAVIFRCAEITNDTSEVSNL